MFGSITYLGLVHLHAAAIEEHRVCAANAARAGFEFDLWWRYVAPEAERFGGEIAGLIAFLCRREWTV